MLIYRLVSAGAGDGCARCDVIDAAERPSLSQKPRALPPGAAAGGSLRAGASGMAPVLGVIHFVVVVVVTNEPSFGCRWSPDGIINRVMVLNCVELVPRCSVLDARTVLWISWCRFVGGCLPSPSPPPSPRLNRWFETGPRLLYNWQRCIQRCSSAEQLVSPAPLIFRTLRAMWCQLVAN